MGARWWIAGLLVSGLVLGWPDDALLAQEFSAAAHLDPGDVVGIDEIVVFEIEVNTAGSLQMLEPDFELDNFALVGGPFQSTSLRIVNGVQSTGRSLSWQLKPLHLGKAKVHAIRIETGHGRVTELDPAEVQVVEEAPRRAAGGFNRGSDPFASLFGEDPLESFFSRPRSRRRTLEQPRIFLHAEATPDRPWVGEQVIYTLYLYTETDVSSINPIELPEFKGFWALKIPQPDQLRPQMVNHDGRRYGRVVLLQWALFPRRAGSFELPPVSARMAVRFMDDTFPALIPRSREITRESNPTPVEVRELPEPAPPGFTGAVGDLALEASLTPEQLAVGEAATLTVKVSGKGHLQGLPAPQLAELAGLKIFPPQQQSDERLNGKEVYGARAWSFVVVPERPGQWELPALEMPFFDPARGQYRTASAAAMTVTARGPTQLAQASGDTLQLHSIRTSVLPLAASGPHLPTSLGLLIVPWLLVGAVLVVRRRDLGHASHAARKQLLTELDRVAGEDKPREAAARIEEAWRGYLEARWSIPPGTPSTQWPSLLSERGVDERAGRELAELADDLHYLRYAPKLSSVDELRAELVERSRRLIKTVR